MSCHPDLPARLLVIKNKTILLISSSCGNGRVKSCFLISFVHVKRGKGVSSFPQTDTSDTWLLCQQSPLHIAPRGYRRKRNAKQEQLIEIYQDHKINHDKPTKHFPKLKKQKKTNLFMFTTNTKTLTQLCSTSTSRSSTSISNGDMSTSAAINLASAPPKATKGKARSKLGPARSTCPQKHIL